MRFSCTCGAEVTHTDLDSISKDFGRTSVRNDDELREESAWIWVKRTSGV